MSAAGEDDRLADAGATGVAQPVLHQRCGGAKAVWFRRSKTARSTFLPVELDDGRVGAPCSSSLAALVLEH